jgi:hypothetical protein
MTSDTQMASELSQEGRIQLAITTLKDGTLNTSGKQSLSTVYLAQPSKLDSMADAP